MEKFEWAQAFLQTLGAPPTRENVAFMCAWVDMEGTKAAWNPLATTSSAAGATNFNSVGVKNFASFQSGIETTVHTLHNGYYPNILNGLMSGNQQLLFQGTADRPASRDWNYWTGNSDYSSKLQARMEQYLADPNAMREEMRATSGGPLPELHVTPFEHLPSGAFGAVGSFEGDFGNTVVVDPVHGADVSTSHDGLTDAFKVEHGLDPHSIDSNHDHISDVWEVTHLGVDAALHADADHDGISNAVELVMGHDPTHTDAGALAHLPTSGVDSDHDGLDDLIEKIIGTNPHSIDSNHDGLTDAMSIRMGIDPLADHHPADGHVAGLDHGLGDHLADHLVDDHSLFGEHSVVAEHAILGDHIVDPLTHDPLHHDDLHGH
jgi:Bacterial TSP3 repeat